MTLDYTTMVVGLGALFIGATSGVAGSFALLRRQSLLGDALAHCALPGIAIAFLWTGERTLPVLLAGAMTSGLIGTFCVQWITRHTRISQDGALGLVLSVFFGFGLVLLTLIQKMPDAGQAGLEDFLFGQAATMLIGDVWLGVWLCGVVCLLMLLFWKEWKLASFDAEYAAAQGWPVPLIDGLLLAVLAGAIVLGLQIVGVVLMSAMIVAPAAAARQWTDNLAAMVLVAAAVGAVSGVGGVMLSSAAIRMPTGPLIVLVAAAIVVGSLLLGRQRGLVWRALQRRRGRRGVLAEQLLQAFYDIAIQHEDPYQPHEVGLIAATQLGAGEYDDLLDLLESRGLIRRIGRYQWALTSTGVTRTEEASNAAGV